MMELIYADEDANHRHPPARLAHLARRLRASPDAASVRGRAQRSRRADIHRRKGWLILRNPDSSASAAGDVGCAGAPGEGPMTFPGARVALAGLLWAGITCGQDQWEP